MLKLGQIWALKRFDQSYIKYVVIGIGTDIALMAALKPENSSFAKRITFENIYVLMNKTSYTLVEDVPDIEYIPLLTRFQMILEKI